jgi:hypothetical protein
VDAGNLSFWVHSRRSILNAYQEVERPIPGYPGDLIATLKQVAPGAFTEGKVDFDR